MTEHVDCVVIGAGVVGLAVARELALAGREVIVLEAAESIGTHTSSRNSEVIHAGLYYPKGSLKARLCVEGKHKLYAYCARSRRSSPTWRKRRPTASPIWSG
jgi:L-2-hydroxyglutarate oxidase LhgO